LELPIRFAIRIRILPQEFKKKLNLAVFTRNPDPHGSAFIRVAGSGSGSRRAKIMRIRIQEGKNDPAFQNMKFLYFVDVLFQHLASSVAEASFMEA
jgi:hypothetical protein